MMDLSALNPMQRKAAETLEGRLARSRSGFTISRGAFSVPELSAVSASVRKASVSGAGTLSCSVRVSSPESGSVTVSGCSYRSDRRLLRTGCAPPS